MSKVNQRIKSIKWKVDSIVIKLFRIRGTLDTNEAIKRARREARDAIKAVELVAEQRVMRAYDAGRQSILATLPLHQVPIAHVPEAAILQREADAAQRAHGSELPSLAELQARNDEFVRRNQAYAASLHTQHVSIARSPLRRHALTPMPPVDDGWLNDRMSNAS